MTVITISEIRVECHKFEGCPQLFMSLLFPTYDIINDDVLLITEIYNKLKPDIPAEFDFDFTFNFKDLALFNYTVYWIDRLPAAGVFTRTIHESNN
ncbi:MAG: hypothetical protein ABI863_10335 [Ginsengibacter sp.]